MFWFGFLIGLCAGVVLVSLAYSKLTQRFDECEARLLSQRDLLNEAISECGRLSAENNTLRHLKGKR